MNRWTVLPAVMLFVGFIAIGCSGGEGPISPPADQEPAQELTPGTERAAQQSQTQLWGYYDLVFNVESRTVEAIPNRSTMFAANIVTFLNASPTGLQIAFNGVTPGPGYYDVDIDLTINHPLDNEAFNGYDVMGVFIGEGSGVMDYDSDLVYPQHGTDQVLLNADGYTRWFNPTGFYQEGLFGYTPGNLATSGYEGTATLNGYKYFGEGLGATNDLTAYLVSGDPNAGCFLHGTGNTRNYQLRFPTPLPGLKYGYAIIANWAGADPGDHPAHAYEAVGCSVDDTSTVYYVDETDNGGNLVLDIVVFEWDAELTGGVMLDYDIILESTVLLSEYDLNTSEMTPTAGGDHWNTYHVELPADSVLTTVGNELWVVVEDSYADYTNPFGVPNEADDDPLAACFRFDLPIGDEPPPPPDPWLEVISPNGGQTWGIGTSQEILWESSGDFTDVIIGLSMNSGASYDYTIIPSTPNDDSFIWEDIPVELLSENCRIKIKDPVGGIASDESDADFTISGNWIEVISPNGGESWKVLSDHEITWESSELTGEVYIEYSKDDFVSDINPIVNHTPNDGGYMWVDIPNDLSDTVKVRVYSIDPLMSDTSDAVFSIIGPDEYITVLSPNGGEEWELGSDQEITWDSFGVTGNVNIYCSRDNFVTDVYTIVEDEPNTLSYVWEDISAAHSDTLRVKVEWDDYPIISDISDADFSIIDIGWGRAWGGPADDTDEGNAVAVDNSGNVYVTGTFYGSFDFDPDPFGGYILTSNGSEDAFLSKFDAMGNFVWARSWGSTTGDTNEDVAVDSYGNVYVTGSFYYTVDFDPDPIGEYTLTSNGYDDIYLLKLDSSGNFVWARSWGGTSWGDEGCGVAIDSTGDVYVTGSFQLTVDFDPDPVDEFPLTSIGSYDAFLSKFDSSGNFVWAGAWGGSSGDKGYGVAVDGTGNAYVTGFFQGTVDFDPDPVDEFPQTSNSLYDVFLSKFDSSGNFEWARTWGGSSYDYGYGVAVDGSGNAYVTGNFQNTVDFDPDPVDEFPLTSIGSYDAFLSKFDSSGNFVWAGAWGGSDGDKGAGVAVDSSGNCYVTGHFYSIVDFDPDPVGESFVTSAGYNDGFLSKFDPTGNFEWVRTVGESSYERAQGVAVDGFGNIYTTGYFESSTIDLAPSESPCFEDPDLHDLVYYSDIFLVKYMPDGCW